MKAQAQYNKDCVGQGWQNSGFFHKNLNPAGFIGVLLDFVNFYILLLLKLFLLYFIKKEAIKVIDKVRNGK